MLLVILGAGASFDSVNEKLAGLSPMDAVEKPPLADDLFANRRMFGRAIDAFPQCRPIMNRLREPSSGTLEQRLQAINEEGESYQQRRVQIAAIRFYLQQIINECGTGWQGLAHGVTNYAALLDYIEHWRMQRDETVCLLTFNYDRMLEQACVDALGLSFHSMDDYVRSDSYSLIKIHGSVDWARTVISPPRSEVNAPPERWMIDNVDSLQFDDLPVVTQPGRWETSQAGNLLFPALAIPVETKTEFVCPEDHLARLDQALDTADRVLIIGWRATEHHFLSRWQTRTQPANRKFMLVAGGDVEAQAIWERLPFGGPRIPTNLGFSSLLVGEGRSMLHDWLYSF